MYPTSFATPKLDENKAAKCRRGIGKGAGWSGRFGSVSRRWKSRSNERDRHWTRC